MECSGTDQDHHHYWAKDRVRGNHRVHVGADDAVCVDEGDPGDLTYMVGVAGKGHCGCWLETTHLGSWRRSGADREAGLDLWVHTHLHCEGLWLLMFWGTVSGRTPGLDLDFVGVAAAVVAAVAGADGEAASGGPAPACWGEP